MEYLAKKDVWCIEIHLPMAIHGFVCWKQETNYMFINANLSPEAKEEAIEHEFDHIDSGDLFSDEDASVIEERKQVTGK